MFVYIDYTAVFFFAWLIYDWLMLDKKLSINIGFKNV